MKMSMKKTLGVLALNFGAVACGDASGPSVQPPAEPNTATVSLSCNDDTFSGLTYEADALVFVPGRDDSEACNAPPASPSRSKDAGADAAAGGEGNEPAPDLLAISRNDQYQLFAATQSGGLSTPFASVSTQGCSVTATDDPKDVRKTTYNVTCTDGEGSFSPVDRIVFKSNNDGSCNTGKYKVYVKDFAPEKQKMTLTVSTCTATYNK
jgi:hypothetical protein